MSLKTTMFNRSSLRGMTIEELCSTQMVQMGFDPNYLSKSDDAAIALRIGHIALEPILFKPDDLHDMGRMVFRTVKEWNVDILTVDASGGGAFVVSHLNALGLNARACNFGSASPEEGFANMRAYLWGQMADWARKPTTVLPPGEYVRRQLSTPRYHTNASNKLQIEAKDQIRKRLKTSTDWGDALAMTFLDDTNRKVIAPTGMLDGSKHELVHRNPDGSKVYSGMALRELRDRHRKAEVFDPYEGAGSGAYDPWE